VAFRFLDDVTVADVAFEAWGSGLEELLRSAWQALLEVMLPGGGAPPDSADRSLSLAAPGEEELLFALLEKIVYVKDAEGLLLVPLELRLARRGEGMALDARARAARAEELGERLGTDVKAVTMHRFALAREAGGYRATVVLDV